MVVGSVIVSFCLLLLGWTKEIVGAFVTDPETVSTPDTRGHQMDADGSHAETGSHDHISCVLNLRPRLRDQCRTIFMSQSDR